MATDIRQLLPTTVRAALLAGSAPSALNPYITASALSSFGFVPYTGATANVDLGAFSLISPQIIGGSASGGTLTIDSTSNATKGAINFGTVSSDNVYNFNVGSSSALVRISGRVGATSQAAIYFNQASPAVGNAALYGLNTTTILNCTSGGTVNIANGGSSVCSFTNTGMSFTPLTVSAGSITSFTFTKPNNTGQTASTNIQGFLFTTGSRQWNTGSITTQQEFLITSPTYSFASASTITDAYTLYVNAPTAGTNATITNNWAGGFEGNVSIYHPSTNRKTIIAPYSGSSFINAIYMLSSTGGATTVTPSTTNHTLWGDGSNTNINAPSGFVQFSNGTARTSGAIRSFYFTPTNNTGQTASTEISSFDFIGIQRQWATGAITTQREFYIKSPTYSFVGASTITNAYTLFVETPTLGTNATITNRYAAGFSGGIEVTTGNSLFRGVVTISRGVDANVTNFSVSSGTANIGVFSLNTDQPNSRVLLTSRNSNTLNLGTQDTIRMSIDTSGNIICGVGAIATNATNGFLYVPTCAGVPTGTPTTVTGRVPIVADSTNNRLYIYSGGAWVALN